MKQLPVAPFAAAYKNRYRNKEKMHNPITLIVKDRRGNTLDLFDLIPAAAPRHIDAVPGAYYQFCDDTTGIAPPSLHAARYGDALHVSFGGTTALVIEQYFSRGQGALIGVQENGGMQRYPLHLAAEVADAPAPEPEPPPQYSTHMSAVAPLHEDDTLRTLGLW